MAGVFVSYAREDLARAQVIASAFEEAGLDVWFDQRIHSGSEYSREIEAALASASAVVVLWSRFSIESAWVRDEAAEGRDSGRLVSVLLDDCRPPIGFRQFQTADLSDWSGRGRPQQIDNVIAAVRAKSGAAPVSPSRTTAKGRSPTVLWLRWAVAALILFAIAAGGFWYMRGMGDGPAEPLSLALLPFTADNSDPEARKLAAAAHAAVAHTLSQGAFAVTTLETAPSGGGPAADFLISGQVTATAEKFVASVRMDESTHHFVVFSHQFETPRDKVEGFPELIGAQVASQLSWTAPILEVERRHPSDPAIIASLLQSSSAGPDAAGTLHDYETSRRLAAKAPNSPLAQNSLAFTTAFALYQLPRADRAQAVATARRAAERTRVLAPEFGGAYIPWCLLHSEQRMVECEDHLRTGMRADPDGSFDNFFLSRLLNNGGRNHEAAELANLSLAHDQYMPLKIAQALRMLETMGQTAEAAELYERSTRWWPGHQGIIWFRMSGIIQRGDFDAARRFGEKAGGPFKPGPILDAINRKSILPLRASCRGAQETDAVLCILGLGYLGDLDTAFAMAERIYPSRRGRTAADQERIWLDNPTPMPTIFLTGQAAAPLRRDPRYLALAERVGLLEYWRSGRPPDFCRERREPICPKLLARR